MANFHISKKRPKIRFEYIQLPLNGFCSNSDFASRDTTPQCQLTSYVVLLNLVGKFDVLLANQVADRITWHSFFFRVPQALCSSDDQLIFIRHTFPLI
ncbi:hypothetical protein D3C76_1353620 [compost metagenome]